MTWVNGIKGSSGRWLCSGRSFTSSKQCDWEQSQEHTTLFFGTSCVGIHCMLHLPLQDAVNLARTATAAKASAVATAIAIATRYRLCSCGSPHQIIPAKALLAHELGDSDWKMFANGQVVPRLL